MDARENLRLLGPNERGNVFLMNCRPRVRRLRVSGVAATLQGAPVDGPGDKAARQRELEQVGDVLRRTLTVDDYYHPTPAQLAAYRRNSPSLRRKAREAIRLHLRTCTVCTEDLAHLSKINLAARRSYRH